MTTQSTKCMLLFHESAFLRIQQVDSIMMSTENTTTGFWPFLTTHKTHVLKMTYVDAHGVKHEYTERSDNLSVLQKHYRLMIEQLKMQLREDEYLTNALEEAMNKV